MGGYLWSLTLKYEKNVEQAGREVIDVSDYRMGHGNPPATAMGSAWVTPVYVRIGYGASEVVASCVVAMDYLKHRWPPERGEAYRRALQSCELAEMGLIDIETARLDFVEAAREAFVLS